MNRLRVSKRAPGLEHLSGSTALTDILLNLQTPAQPAPRGVFQHRADEVGYTTLELVETQGPSARTPEMPVIMPRYDARNPDTSL